MTIRVYRDDPLCWIREDRNENQNYLTSTLANKNERFYANWDSLWTQAGDSGTRTLTLFAKSAIEVTYHFSNETWITGSVTDAMKNMNKCLRIGYGNFNNPDTVISNIQYFSTVPYVYGAQGFDTGQSYRTFNYVWKGKLDMDQNESLWIFNSWILSAYYRSSLILEIQPKFGQKNSYREQVVIQPGK